MDKVSLRAKFSRLRAQAARAFPDAGEALAERVEIACYGADIIAGYDAIGDELDPAALLARLQRAGASIALPRLDATTGMLFCLADPARMETGRFGIRQPDASCPPVQPDIIFLPLVACDASGVRLGRGGGHYDRALGDLDACGHGHLRVGLAFDEQIAARLPRAAHDQSVHRIETPTRSILSL